MLIGILLVENLYFLILEALLERVIAFDCQKFR